MLRRSNRSRLRRVTNPSPSRTSRSRPSDASTYERRAVADRDPRGARRRPAASAQRSRSSSSSRAWAERAQQVRRRGPLDGGMGAVEQRGCPAAPAAPPSRRRSSRPPSPRTIVSFEPGQRGVPEFRRRQAGRERLERGAHTVAQQLAVHRRQGRVGRPRRQRRPGHGAVRPDPRGVARLREVVVVAGEPEHRHHRPAPALLEHPGERAALRALWTVYSGPVNSPGCCPVVTARAPGVAAARAGLAGDRGHERRRERGSSPPARSSRRLEGCSSGW